ncbi:hypothetical protein [Faecalibacter bovis]|uniref:Lipocalin-like domain-containing protein n=1 Tax=Faecalibacter bovis TaxID=2898187 RepID=A0ABX7XF42_9FLAO|nr:hypothetical protein [Faecalibacter bovis]QTV06500.1 hypothetical protein J9309_04030 [Faecalibacter bovis]
MKDKLQILFILLGILGLYSCNNDDDSNSNSNSNYLEGIWQWENVGTYKFENDVLIDSTIEAFTLPNRQACMKQKKIQFTSDDFLENHLIHYNNGCEFRTMKFPYEFDDGEFRINTEEYKRKFFYKKISNTEMKVYYYKMYMPNGQVWYDYETYKRIN